MITPPPAPPRQMTSEEMSAWCRHDPSSALDYAFGLFSALCADDQALVLEQIEDLRLQAELPNALGCAAGAG